MALMERKREKKAKDSATKPATQPSPVADDQDLAEPAPVTESGPAKLSRLTTSKRKPVSLVEAAAASSDSGATEAPSLDVMTSYPKPSDLFVIKKETPALRPSKGDVAFAIPAEPAMEAGQEAIEEEHEIDSERTGMEYEDLTVEPAMEAGSETIVEEHEIDAELAGVEYEDLTDIEKDILRVAKDSLKKKRFETDIGFEPFTPMVEKLINDCLAKYHAQKGYSKESIIETLRGLCEQKWIVTAERRTKDEIFGTKLYQDIIKLLQDYPGTHARDDRIQTILGITRNPFLKHMLVLERFDLIKKRKFGKLWNFFALSFDEDDNIAELVVVLYNDIVRQLVQLLLKNSEMTLVELAESVIPPVYHGAIQYHLKKLEELGLVSPGEGGGNRSINTDMLQRYNAVVCDALKIQLNPL